MVNEVLYNLSKKKSFSIKGGFHTVITVCVPLDRLRDLTSKIFMIGITFYVLS